ncbi:ribonuclease P protein component [Williamsia serinedens]|uniref:Ribonuclease P protein component n=1 Tax=Williamsia serinedens TaxID=391736 RepID=A0ABT1GY41_9NOCA|nr:ribonuclease P protein component [Williamsia serinedens]
MLARHQRISRSSDFTRALRRGVRVRRADIQVHAARIDETDVLAVERGARYGLIVSKSVGDAVTRHAVARRLRAAAAAADAGGGLGTDASGLVVIRALPGAAHRSGSELTDELVAALRLARTRLGEREQVRA